MRNEMDQPQRTRRQSSTLKPTMPLRAADRRRDEARSEATAPCAKPAATAAAHPPLESPHVSASAADFQGFRASDPICMCKHPRLVASWSTCKDLPHPDQRPIRARADELACADLCCLPPRRAAGRSRSALALCAKKQRVLNSKGLHCELRTPAGKQIARHGQGSKLGHFASSNEQRAHVLKPANQRTLR